jgi:hypothetical protein
MNRDYLLVKRAALSRRAEPTPACEASRSAATSGRCMSGLANVMCQCRLIQRHRSANERMVRTVPIDRGSSLAAIIADFCNNICQQPTSCRGVSPPTVIVACERRGNLNIGALR